MRNILILALALFTGYFVYQGNNMPLPPETPVSSVQTATLTIPASASSKSDTALAMTSSDQTLARAFEQRQSNVQIQGSGVVLRVLADDNNGNRHQRFILQLASGQTLLVAHNINLADRVAGIAEGDRVEFYGEYEWNAEGGVMHWTHNDPQREHVAGWLKHRGRTYQ